jgi:hypothetical protein
VPSYDVPYILRDGQGQPLDMGAQTILHAIHDATVAAVQPLFSGIHLEAGHAWTPRQSGIYYMMHRVTILNTPDAGTDGAS